MGGDGAPRRAKTRKPRTRPLRSRYVAHARVAPAGRTVRMVLRARGSAPIAPSQLLLGVDPLENAGNLNFRPNRAAARCGDAAG
jgi:hypothetical protein